MPKGGAPKTSSPKHYREEPSLTHALAHRALLQEQRDAVRAHPHGTDKSKRGVRIRVNPGARRARSSGGVTRGGAFRG